MNVGYCDKWTKNRSTKQRVHLYNNKVVSAQDYHIMVAAGMW